MDFEIDTETSMSRYQEDEFYATRDLMSSTTPCNPCCAEPVNTLVPGLQGEPGPVGPLTINPNLNGVVWVELESLYDAQGSIPTYWDHIVTT